MKFSFPSFSLGTEAGLTFDNKFICLVWQHQWSIKVIKVGWNCYANCIFDYVNT